MAGFTKRERRWSALTLIVTAQFMVILDVAIVNVALPSIKTDLNFSQANLPWVISAYAILFGGALLLGGRLAICSAGGGSSSPVCPVHGQLAPLRRCLVGGIPDRIPRFAGSRRSVARPGRSLAADNHVR